MWEHLVLGSVTDALHNLSQFIKNETISKVFSSFRIIWVLCAVKLEGFFFHFPSVLQLCLFVASGSHTVVQTTVWETLPSVTEQGTISTKKLNIFCSWQVSCSKCLVWQFEIQCFLFNFTITCCECIHWGHWTKRAVFIYLFCNL